MKKKRILVTGGCGFIGSALVQRLVKENYSVRVLDNQSRGSAERLRHISGDFEFVRADIRDKDAVQQAIRGIDCVWHLAFVNGTEFFYTKPDLVLDVGVKGIINILDACIRKNVRELILASSSEVYQTPRVVPTDESAPISIPDPLNPRYSYAAGKIISEIMAINYGRKHFERVVIFRPHNVYGPDMGTEHVVPQFLLRMRKMCRKTKAKKIRFPIQGTGRETRAFVFIADLINGLMLLMDKGSHLGIYHIGTTEELTIKKVAVEIGKYFGRDIEIVPGEAANGAAMRRCPDISKMLALGYRPKYEFCKGLPITARWYDDNAEKL